MTHPVSVTMNACVLNEPLYFAGVLNSPSGKLLTSNTLDQIIAKMSQTQQDWSNGIALLRSPHAMRISASGLHYLGIRVNTLLSGSQWNQAEELLSTDGAQRLSRLWLERFLLRLQ